MLSNILPVLASFTSPITISNGPAKFILMIPIVVIIAFVYKAVKMPDITTIRYVKSSVILAATVLIFYALIAIGLYAISRIATG